MKNKTVMIIAGEASGDIYGANLVKAIRNKSNNINFYGVGSYAMKSEGVNLIIDSKKLSIMGITEVIFKIPIVLHSIKSIKLAIKKLNVKLLILIDFPEFNLMIASIAKKSNIPILYYVTPQLWAWRKSRIKKIKKLIDRVAVILPFEEKFYKRYNINADFVGHPLLDTLKISSEFIDNKIENDFPTIGLFPGSRNKEISKLLPTMLRSVKIIKQSIPSAKFIVSHANSIDSNNFNKIINQHGKSLSIKISYQPVKEILNKLDCVIAASGTVTLEAALYGVPTIIIYKISTLSYLVGRCLIHVKYIGLVNLILNKRLIPELIQHEVSCDNIAKITLSLLSDKKKLTNLRKQLLCIKNYLGKSGVSKRVAEIAIKMMH